jgi:hypothetical protein
MSLLHQPVTTRRRSCEEEDIAIKDDWLTERLLIDLAVVGHR